RGEFDHSVVEYAHGKPLSEILSVSYRKDGKIVHNAERPQLHTAELDALPFATDIYKRDLKIENYNVPFLLHPFVSFYTRRRRAAVHRRLRVRGCADPEEYQEGRDCRDGAHFHEKLPQGRHPRARRFHHRFAR